MEKLIESNNGSRDIVTMKPNTDYSSLDELKADSNAKRGLYCFSDNECMYVANSDLK